MRACSVWLIVVGWVPPKRSSHTCFEDTGGRGSRSGKGERWLKSRERPVLSRGVRWPKAVSSRPPRPLWSLQERPVHGLLFIVSHHTRSLPGEYRGEYLMCFVLPSTRDRSNVSRRLFCHSTKICFSPQSIMLRRGSLTCTPFPSTA